MSSGSAPSAGAVTPADGELYGSRDTDHADGELHGSRGFHLSHAHELTEPLDPQRILQPPPDPRTDEVLATWRRLFSQRMGEGSLASGRPPPGTPPGPPPTPPPGAVEAGWFPPSRNRVLALFERFGPDMIDDFINGRLLRFATPDVIDALIETMRETFQEEKFNEIMGLWLHGEFLDPNRNHPLVSALRKQGASAPKETF